MKLAPVVIFAYNRKEHLERCIEHLWKNDEFSDSPVYIFCDGPRDDEDEIKVREVRIFLERTDLPSKTQLITSNKNKDLARSVLEGLDYVFERHNEAIVIEDDILSGENMLSFLNKSLDKYCNYDAVGSVSAYWFPINVPHKATSQEAFFLKIASSWAWGTWRKEWQKFRKGEDDYSSLKVQSIEREFDLDGSTNFSDLLKNQLYKSKQISSWAILWRWHLFINDKLTLFPYVSLAQNIGFDGTGRHCGSDEKRFVHESDICKSLVPNFPDSVEVDRVAKKKLIDFYQSENDRFRRRGQHIFNFKKFFKSLLT